MQELMHNCIEATEESHGWQQLWCLRLFPSWLLSGLC